MSDNKPLPSLQRMFEELFMLHLILGGFYALILMAVGPWFMGANDQFIGPAQLAFALPCSTLLFVAAAYSGLGNKNGLATIIGYTAIGLTLVMALKLMQNESRYLFNEDCIRALYTYGLMVGALVVTAMMEIPSERANKLEKKLKEMEEANKSTRAHQLLY